MKICPWCNGKGITGQLARGEELDSVMLLGHKIPIIGTMIDVCCKFCDGKGFVDREGDLADAAHEREEE